MNMKSRIEKLEKRGGVGDETVAILLAGRDANHGGKPLPPSMPMTELEELAKRYPRSMWPRLWEARKRVGG